MTIERRRRHRAVTHGCQRLDAEKETIRESARLRVGDASGLCKIEKREDDIDAEVQSEESERESLPAYFKSDMIGSWKS